MNQACDYLKTSIEYREAYINNKEKGDKLVKLYLLCHSLETALKARLYLLDNFSIKELRGGRRYVGHDLFELIQMCCLDSEFTISLDQIRMIHIVNKIL